ncbi:MAG: hypothetical protein Q8M76_07685, partial [Spirochaetaceae bacterium]|nr:hypothetical protein [Spirochaetaceae bacterium]
MAQALSIYNGPLRSRYPDDAARVMLLKLYRENDPRYSLLQAKLVMDLADALARRVVSAINAILAPLENADLSNAIGALKAVEALIARLPGEIEDAVAALARYEAFARVLRHKAALAGKALELLREYEAVSKADSPADYDFIARSAAIEERRRTLASHERGGAHERGEDRYDFV